MMGICFSSRSTGPNEKPLRLPNQKSIKPEGQHTTLYRDLPPPGESDHHDVPLIGVAKITVVGAKLRKKGNYNVTLSMGMQVMSSLHVHCNAVHMPTDIHANVDPCRASCPSPGPELLSQNSRLNEISWS